MTKLSEKRCIPCEGGVQPLTRGEAKPLLSKLHSAWEISNDGKKLSRNFTFSDFVQAMLFVNDVAIVAQSENHHPDISIHYNKVRLELWTHAIGGLSENDFIVAAKIDTRPER
jgi:4a-hydroxytetrahydrobiopterin dehydratase